MLPPLRKDRPFTTCPTCGSVCRMVYREDGHADHYRIEDNRMAPNLAEVDTKTASYLRGRRGNKKTVALVGKSPTSCSLAPYRENKVEIWTLTNAHKYPWMLRWNRLFEMHILNFVQQYDPAQPEWLIQKHDKPIYMQFHHDEIPDSVEYPFRDICDTFFKNAYHGTERVKYFTSTFAYMIALALMEGFERIECYGFEMQFDDAYGYQRKNAEFWMGLAIGRGVDFYLPQNCPILQAKLYGYETNNTDY
jgi:hypothetical protein